ncbi:hypothetical protein F2Q70_00029204 [Brassica cretica]|uniref:Uncharacterized protein n=1 Tax=Brassica cretica TaxID=69181 RepID=A0A8S9FBY9_BRACR|nr:hypothetical protein F2Q70_00029204 [Brassica cretica]
MARRKAEKEPIHVCAEHPSSSAPVVTPAVDPVVQAPQDAGEQSGTDILCVSDASAQPSGSSTTPIVVDDKEKNLRQRWYVDGTARMEFNNSDRPSGMVSRYVATDSFAGRSLCSNQLSGLVGRYRPRGLVGRYVATGSFADRSLLGDLCLDLYLTFHERALGQLVFGGSIEAF